MEKNMLELANRALTDLKNGSAFLVTADGEGKENVMTIGWGAMGVMWSKPVMIVPVRLSRYSHGLISKGTEFVVSVPAVGTMRGEIATCGRISGRDGDKFTVANLTKKQARKVSVPVIDKCEINVECKLLGRCILPMAGMNDAVNAKYYAGPNDGDVHELFFGEIVDCYE